MSIILVADDHPLNRHFLATLLSYKGHQVIEAADGVEGLDRVREQRPDLIIADVAMPRMDGFAFVRTLRSEPSLADIPIIFYTASYREEESRAIARAAGVEHLIMKPSDPEVILETVGKAMGQTAAAAKHDQRRASWGQAREYIDRLQVASIRMSALIELSLELNTERDPDRLMRTACRAVRTILASEYAVIALAREAQKVRQWWIEGAVDPTRIEEFFAQTAPYMSSSPRRGSGLSDPLVMAMKSGMAGVESVLIVPMSTRRDLYGWILLGRLQSSSPFSVDDERFALATAGEIRAAHENLMLYRALHQQTSALSRTQEDLEIRMDHRTSELELANEALIGEIAQRRGVEEELRASQQELTALFDASPVAIIAFDSNRIVRVWNAAAERVFGWRAEEVIGRTNPAISPDGLAQYETLVEQCLAGKTHTEIELQRMRRDGSLIDVSLSMAPLHDARGARGYVSIFSDITDRKRGEAELRSSRERSRALSARVLSIQEQERTRIARELHDELGQLLTAIKIDVSRLIEYLDRRAPPEPKLVDGILPLIDATIDTTIRIVSELRPSRIDEIGLSAAIEKKLREFQERFGIECDLSIRPAELNVAEEVAIAVFRILEEALTNIARHSGATRAEVRLRKQGNELLLEVRDNGRGIRDSERLASNAYGLIGMKERASVFGGSFGITGVEGKGTIVTVRIPLSGSAGLKAAC